MSSRSTGTVLLGIIALAGIGLSGYMFVKYEFLSPITPTKDSGLILVGLWDDLYSNADYAPWNTTDDWLLAFHNSPLNDSNYISVSNGNTHFVLVKTGFYKITLTILLYTLNADTTYWVYLRRNGDFDHAFERISISANPSASYYQVQSSLYVYGNGVDSFVINCYNSLSASFTVSSSQFYNQLSIEYVLE